MPSVTGVWRGADWFERYCFDMYGIRFTDHPDMRRLLMYDEFVGHPLRKDYPLKGRQPLVDGARGPRHRPRARARDARLGPSARLRAIRETETVTDHKGPGGLDTEATPGSFGAGAAEHPPAARARTSSTPRSPSRRMTVNLGPSHPAMHGVTRAVVELEGEIIRSMKLDIGFLHRGFEKSCENVTWTQCFPYTDRLNYVSLDHEQRGLRARGREAVRARRARAREVPARHHLRDRTASAITSRSSARWRWSSAR